MIVKQMGAAQAAARENPAGDHFYSFNGPVLPGADRTAADNFKQWDNKPPSRC